MILINAKDKSDLISTDIMTVQNLTIRRDLFWPNILCFLTQRYIISKLCEKSEMDGSLMIV